MLRSQIILKKKNIGGHLTNLWEKKMKSFKIKIREKVAPQQYFWLEWGLLELWSENLGKSSSPQKQQNTSEITFFRTLEINQKLTAISVVITEETLNFSKNSRVVDVYTWPTPIPLSTEMQFKTTIRYHFTPRMLW